MYAEPDKARLRAAFERVAPEMAAIPAEQLSRVNADVPTAIGKVLAALPKIRALRGSIAALPKFDLERFDRIEDYALALLYAHGAHVIASAKPQSLEELGAEATTLKEVLLGDATTQAVRKIFEAKHLADIRAGTGYRDLGADLIALVRMYRGHWAELEGRTAISAAELERAELLADRLIVNMGIREQVPLKRAAAIVERERVFYLFNRAYTDARQAIAFVRREEQDADKIAPTFYSGGRPVGSGAEDAAPELPSIPGTNAPGTPIVPSDPNAPGTTASSAQPSAPSAGAPPAGFPGAPAFTRP